MMKSEDFSVDPEKFALEIQIYFEHWFHDKTGRVSWKNLIVAISEIIKIRDKKLLGYYENENDLLDEECTNRQLKIFSNEEKTCFLLNTIKGARQSLTGIVDESKLDSVRFVLDYAMRKYSEE